MKAVECMGRVSAVGTLLIPETVLRELQLRPAMQVKVILLQAEETEEEKARLAAERAEIWRQVDALREQLAGKEGNLTEALLQARQEEDDAMCGRETP